MQKHPALLFGADSYILDVSTYSGEIRNHASEMVVLFSFYDWRVELPLNAR